MDTTKGFMLALVVVLLVLSTVFVLPFLQYFLLAVLLAYVLAPLLERLEPRIGRRLGAGVLVLGATVAVIVPVVVVSRVIASEAAAIVRGVQRGEISLAGVETVIERRTGLDVDLAAQLQTAVGGLDSGTFDNVLGVFGFVTHVAVGLGLTVFLLYYFLKDGERFFSWLRGVLPVADHVVDDLYADLDAIIWAVLVGHVFVAFVQGVIAGLGLVVTGVPNALFWTSVMVVLSLLPLVGSFLVWGPAAVYLAANGQPLAAAFLAVYGTIVVGVSDDYLRPVVVDRYAQVNPSVIIIGVLGGIYTMGFVGVFFGPIVIAALRVTLDLFEREFVAPEAG